jgi:hypothetical protein
LGTYEKWVQLKRSFLTDPCFLYMVLPAALLSGILYYRLIDMPNLEARMVLHQQICLGEADSPYRYRILVPYAIEIAPYLVSRWVSYKVAFQVAYGLYDIFSLCLFFGALYYWLRLWHSQTLSLLGVLFACATIPVAYWHHYFQPWSLLEAALFTISLSLVVKNKTIQLSFVIIIYTLLRETSIFLPLLYLLAYRQLWRSNENGARTWRIWTAVYFAEWLLIYGGLRLWLGNAPHVETLPRLIGVNFSSRNLLLTAIYLFIMFGGFLVWAKQGFQQSNFILKQISYIILPYLVIMGIWAIWSEVRCFIPLYPIVLALGLYKIREWLGWHDETEKQA